jgi:hypothetical protein
LAHHSGHKSLVLERIVKFSKNSSAFGAEKGPSRY